MQTPLGQALVDARTTTGTHGSGPRADVKTRPRTLKPKDIARRKRDVKKKKAKRKGAEIVAKNIP